MCTINYFSIHIQLDIHEYSTFITIVNNTINKSFFIGAKKKKKSWLKTQHSENEDHGISSQHFMANKWGNNGNRNFILGGSKITADSDCSYGIKRRLLLVRKAMINLDSILKSRDIILPTKVHLLKTGFSGSQVWI